jgi:hypothetical protein
MGGIEPWLKKLCWGLWLQVFREDWAQRLHAVGRQMRAVWALWLDGCCLECSMAGVMAACGGKLPALGDGRPCC